MKKLIFLLTCFYFAGEINATHNRAGEITYKRIQPFTANVGGVQVQVYTYSITVTIYTDFGDQTADRCQDTLYFGDGSKTVLNRENGNASIAGCQCSPKCGEIIVNQPGYNVKKNIYSAVHTYPGPGQYVAFTADRNRNSGIYNIPNSVNTPFYIEALIIANASIGTNSSPVLNNPPIDMAYNVTCFYHQPGAFDADGDSLSYELISCKGQNGAAIIGYTQPPISNNGYYYMNTSGLISWCTPPNIGEYSIAFYVREWRKINGVYQIIGLIERDLQILVRSGVLGLSNTSPMGEALNIYPIPFSSQLSISTEGLKAETSKAELLSLDGKLLMIGTIHEDKIEFSTKQLNNGLYLLKITSGDAVAYRKILKSN